MKKMAAFVVALLATGAVAASAPTTTTPPRKVVTSRPTNDPGRTSMSELNQMVKAGDYHLVRRQKIAHLLEFRATVRIARDTPLVELPGAFWSAHLNNVPPDRAWKKGDPIVGKALIVDEAYAALFLWVYEWRRE